MLCDDAKRVIYFLLDEQLGEGKRKEVSEHLGICADCEERSRISGRLRLFFRRRIDKLDAPSHLKRRLERSIRAFRAEWNA